MTLPRAIELLVALAIIAAGVVVYRRRDGSDTYGSQGAVLLFVIGVIVAIHALSLMEYHPTAAEADMMRGQAQ
jgi:hypothetical protein